MQKSLAAVATAALVLIAAAATTGRAELGPPGVTAVPCPVAAWTSDDPAFEAMPGARAISGGDDGGLYRIEIPHNWNGELVLWAHGFVDSRGPQGARLRVGFPGGGQAGQGPSFREHLVAKGFAWAASSYRCNGYVPGVGLLDTMALVDVFSKVNGGKAPQRVYLAGGSMGGHVTILGLQEFPKTFAAGLAMCPAGPGEMDFLAAVAAASEKISGVTVSGAARNEDAAQLTRALGEPPAYTEMGRQLAGAQIEISGGPRPFALEGLAPRFTLNVIAGAAVRESPEWNGAGARARYEETSPFDGRIERPLMTLHGTGDLYVPISLQQVLKRAVDTAGRPHLLVQRIMRIPGHCAFSRQEQVRAFDDLVAWVRAGRRPEGDEVFGDLTNAGLRFTDPLRPGDPGTLRLPGSAAAVQ